MTVTFTATALLLQGQTQQQQNQSPATSSAGQSQTKGPNTGQARQEPDAQMPPGHDMSKMGEKQTSEPKSGTAMDHSQSDMQDMPNMPGMQGMSDMNAASMFLMGQSSGTAMNPLGWPMPAIMARLGSWHAMFMGQAFIVETQQSGPRGGDKLYSANWFMGVLFIVRALRAAS
jgi:hypothetical protein